MRTQVDGTGQSWASKAVELGWLLLVVALPLVYSTAVYNGFIAPKLALFRSVVELMAAAGIAAWWFRPSRRARPGTHEVGGGAAGERRRGPEVTDDQPASAGLPANRPVVHGRGRLPRVGPLLVALVLYTATLAAATLAGRNVTVGFWGLYLRGMGAFTLLHGVGLAALVMCCLRTEEQLRRLLGAIALGSVPVVCGAFAQHLGWWDEHWLGIDDVRLRAVSTLGNALLLGSYLVGALPFTVAWALLGSGAARRVLGALLVAGQLGALALTLGRGSWLAAATAGLVFGALWLRRAGGRRPGPVPGSGRGRARWAVCGAVAAAALAVALLALNLAPSVASRIGNPLLRRLASFNETDPTSSGGSRLRYWREVLAGVPDSVPVLLLGHGPQSFVAVHSRRYAPIEADLGEAGEFADSSHNVVMDALNDTGIAGAAAWLGLLAAAAVLAARVLRRRTSPVRHLASMALLAGLAGYLVQGQFLFEHVTSLLFVAVSLGLAGCPALQARPGTEAVGAAEADTSRRRNAPARSRHPGRPVTPVSNPLPGIRPADIGVSVLLLGALGLAVVVGNARPLLAEHLRLRALHLQGEGVAGLDDARALLGRAIRLAPWVPEYRLALADAETVGALWLRQASPGDRAGVEAAFRAAEASLRRAVALDPGDPRSRFPLGILYQLWGATDPARCADAARVCADLAAMSPRRQRTYWLWGDLLLAEGKPREAEAMYRRALELDPHVAAAHGAMAMLYDRLGRSADADRYRRSARALRPAALVIVPHAPPGSGETSTPIQ